MTLVVIGKALGSHGTRGEVRVRWMGDGPGNLIRAPRVALGENETTPALRWYDVEKVASGRGGEARVELRGIETREQAAALAGLLVLGDPSHFETLPAGEHYWYEWIGCAVFASDGRNLGTVKELWAAGAHDVLVVEDQTGRQVLLPAARALLREVDVENRRIVIEVPAGLLDAS